VQKLIRQIADDPRVLLREREEHLHVLLTALCEIVDSAAGTSLMSQFTRDYMLLPVHTAPKASREPVLGEDWASL